MTDERIIELYCERSESAIEETDRTYGKYFRSVAYGILWDEEDAKETVNDTYLKANGQTDGVRSYGRMVDLLLAYYRANDGKL